MVKDRKPLIAKGEEELVLQEAALRLRDEAVRRYRDDEVRDTASRETPFSEDDGWE